MSQQNSSEEIDLGYLFKKSNDFFKSIIRGLFQILDFFKKYYIIVIVLLIIGFGYGYYKDLDHLGTYNNEVIVIPNFESADYLYDKVEAINTKIVTRDTVFLKEIFGVNYLKLEGVKLAPIVDVYNFVSKSPRNFDVLKLIVEKRNISEYIEDISIGKYYKYHRMGITITGKESSEKIVADLLHYLNESEHLQEYKKVFKENNTLKIQEYQNMISQIDSVLKVNSQISEVPTNVSINNSTDLFNLFDKKRQLLGALLEFKTEEIDFSDPIKKVSADYNLKTKKLFQVSNKVKYPLLLVTLFSLVFFILYLFKNLKRYAHSRH